MTPAGTASLPMYPFAAWRAATEALWDDVRCAMPDLPPLASWTDDVHALWHDPAMVVSQACGWPLVTELVGVAHAIGTFRYRTSTWEGDRYRAVVVARDTALPDDLAAARAAVNGTASLSGWVSLVWFAAGGPGGRWPGPVTITGAHLESLRAVRDGDADIAAIDAVTFEHATRDRPELLRGVHVVGHGPEVPCLPIVVRAGADDGWTAELRRALTVAAERRSGATDTLLITGFTALDDGDYGAVADLAPAHH